MSYESTWERLSNLVFHRKHLIVAIGSECYVTLPKGQIVPTHTKADHPDAPSVPGGGHVLIVPIAHAPTYSSFASDIAQGIVSETEKSVPSSPDPELVSHSVSSDTRPR